MKWVRTSYLAVLLPLSIAACKSFNADVIAEPAFTISQQRTRAEAAAVELRKQREDKNSAGRDLYVDAEAGFNSLLDYIRMQVKSSQPLSQTALTTHTRSAVASSEQFVAYVRGLRSGQTMGPEAVTTAIETALPKIRDEVKGYYEFWKEQDNKDRDSYLAELETLRWRDFDKVDTTDTK